MQSTLAWVFLGLLGGILLIVLLSGISVWAYFAYVRRREQAAESGRFRESVAALSKSVEALGNASESLNALPKFVEGYSKIAASMIIEIQSFRKSVEAFSRLIVRDDQQGENPKDESPALQPYSEEAADKVFSINQFLLDHPELDRDQAKQLLESALSPGIE